MLVDIYQSQINPSRHVIVPKGTNPAALANITGDPDFESVSFFKETDFSPGDKKVGTDADTVIANIKAQGWSYL